MIRTNKMDLISFFAVVPQIVITIVQNQSCSLTLSMSKILILLSNYFGITVMSYFYF